MVSSKEIPEGVKTESIISEFIKDDFELDKKVPALYERMMLERSGRSSYRGKLTPERYEAIIRYVRAGAWIAHAANAVGVDDNTVYKWLKLGAEDPDSLYGAFLEDFNRAKSRSINRNVFLIQRAAEDDWGAAKWLLTKQDREIYGDSSTVKTEISGPGGKPIETKVYISDEELRKLSVVQDIIEEQNKVVIEAEYHLIEEDKPKDPDEEEPEKDVVYPEQ